jgi:hypothetical protein
LIAFRAHFKARERGEREENPSAGKITALFMSEALQALTATFYQIKRRGTWLPTCLILTPSERPTAS